MIRRCGQTIACIGTGPSLTIDQVEAARAKGFVLFGCNRVHELAPDLALLFGFKEFWNFYGRIDHPCEKWTIDQEAALRHGLDCIAWRDEAHKGLSTDPAFIHHGKSAGFALVNLAYLSGARRIVLLGYDMKFAPDYDGRAHQVGSGPRHYFGEYPPQLQHWPSVRVRAGIHEELIGFYESIAKQDLDVEIVNCTPGSAIGCFRRARIDAL